MAGALDFALRPSICRTLVLWQLLQMTRKGDPVAGNSGGDGEHERLRKSTDANVEEAGCASKQMRRPAGSACPGKGWPTWRRGEGGGYGCSVALGVKPHHEPVAHTKRQKRETQKKISEKVACQARHGRRGGGGSSARSVGRRQ